MKNKTLQNLIAIGIFVLLIMTASKANAQDLGLYSYTPNYASPIYFNNIYNNSAAQQYNYAQQQPYTYVQAQPQVQYIAQPTTTQIQYVPQQQTVQYVSQPNTNQQIQYVPQQTIRYVNSNSQGASVINATSPTSDKVAYRNTGYSSNTGNYINYDGNNSMGANAYGAAYNNGGQVFAPTPTDNNGVTALSVRGSGSFLPSSIFQWFMLILLILAIIIIARLIAKRSAIDNDPHSIPAH